MDCFDQFCQTAQNNPQTISPAGSKVERDIPLTPVGIGCCLSAISPIEITNVIREQTPINVRTHFSVRHLLIFFAISTRNSKEKQKPPFTLCALLSSSDHRERVVNKSKQYYKLPALRAARQPTTHLSRRSFGKVYTNGIQQGLPRLNGNKHTHPF